MQVMGEGAGSEAEILVGCKCGRDFLSVPYQWTGDGVRSGLSNGRTKAPHFAPPSTTLPQLGWEGSYLSILRLLPPLRARAHTHTHARPPSNFSFTHTHATSIKSWQQETPHLYSRCARGHRFHKSLSMPVMPGYKCASKASMCTTEIQLWDDWNSKSVSAVRVACARVQIKYQTCFLASLERDEQAGQAT
jgi:hypothetical protein